MYYHRKALLLGTLLSSIPDGLTREDGGRWLERAFWLSRLHMHLCKAMTYERAFEFVNSQLMTKRVTEIDADLYDAMVDAGAKPLLARQYRMRHYRSARQFLHHVGIFREYHDPDFDYAKTQVHESTTQGFAEFSGL